MTFEPMDDFELRLARALDRYAEAAGLGLPSPPVTRAPSSRLPALALAAALVLLVVAGGAGWLLSTAGSRAAEVRVDGRTYLVSIARSLELDPADVTPYGPLQSSDEAHLFADMTAYAIRGVDPVDALVVPAAPDQGDDAGPYGDWILLIRGNTRALCPYYDPAAEATPPECRDAGS